MSDTETDDKAAERLRAWGHVATVGVLVLALFAFGLKQETDALGETHLHIHWSEVPAILIVFILAELGIELVGGAQVLTKRMKDARTSVQSLTASAERTAARVEELQRDSAAATTELLDKFTSVRRIVDKSVGTLRSAVTEFTGSVPVLQAGTAFAQKDPNVWHALATFVRAWHVDEMESDAHALPMVRNFFEVFIGPPESPATVRRSRSSSSITCATIDSVYAEMSKRLLVQSSASTERFVVWAVTALHPFEFCVPRLFWARQEGHLTRRVTALEEFVDTVRVACANNAALGEYKRLTVFTDRPSAELPSVKTTPTEAVDAALDRWFVWSPTHAAADLRTALGGKAHDMGDWISDVCGPAVGGMRHHRELRERISGASHKPQEVYALPEPDDPSKLTPYFLDPDLAVAFVPEAALNSGAAAAHAALVSLYKKAKVDPAIASPGSIATALEAAGWLSVRKWYCSTMHKGEPESVARWTVINETTEGVSQFRIDLDERDWTTLDLILIGSAKPDDASPHWVAAVLSDIDLNSPACVVKLVVGQRELQNIGAGVAALWHASESEGGTWQQPMHAKDGADVAPSFAGNTS